MSAEHTKGRLVVATGGGRMLISPDRVPCIAETYNGDAEGNAQRLAACWNACLGIPTSDVQEFASVDRGFMRTVVLAGDREEVVAELLGILREIKNEGLSWDPAYDTKIAAAAAKSNGEEVPRDLITEEAPEPAPEPAPPPSLRIEHGVRASVAKVLCVPVERVQNHMDFINDLEADSLDTVEITMALEDEFGIQIPDHEAEEIKCVQQAIDYVTKAKA